MSPLEFQKTINKMSLEDISSIKDIGPVVARSIYDWFHDPKNQKLIEEIGKADVEIEVKSLLRGQKKQSLKGFTFILTGELDNYTREQAKEEIRERGGDITSSVSKYTNYVIIGKEPGSKYDKAKKLGVKILKEEEFLKML